MKEIFYLIIGAGAFQFQGHLICLLKKSSLKKKKKNKLKKKENFMGIKF